MISNRLPITAATRTPTTIIACVYLIIAGGFISPTYQRRIISSNVDTDNTVSANDVNFFDSFTEFPGGGAVVDVAKSAEQVVKSVPYIRESIPMRIFDCVRQFSVLRCTKLFILQKMEERQNFRNSGNLTRDFLDQFFGEKEQMSSLISGKFANISDAELTQRLVWNFQRFFKNRDIQLHFLPGIMVKIVPSRDNKLKLSLRKKTPQDQSTGRGRRGQNKRGQKKRQSYKETLIQMAVPVMVMPAILMGTFLPFVLPVLKMATIMSTLMNNSALIAALIYAARTHANTQEEQPINYAHPARFH